MEKRSGSLLQHHTCTLFYLFSCFCLLLPYVTCQNNTCVACPAGTYSDQNSTSCSSCNSTTGGYCQESIFCLPCQPGTFSLIKSNRCSPCPPGTVAPVPRSSACSLCRSGQSPNPPQTTCLLCPAGTYSPQPATPSCIACHAGYYSSRGSPSCSLCPPGTFNPYPSQSQCLPCNPGSYSATSGNTVGCKACPAGSYCPESLMNEPIPCPSDYFCVLGAVEKQKCPLFFTSPEKSSNCGPSVSLFVLIGVGAALLIISAVVCWIVIGTRKIWKRRDRLDEDITTAVGSRSRGNGASGGMGGFAKTLREEEEQRVSPAMDMGSKVSGIPAPMPGTPVYTGL